jgi:uncharacterized protein (DUF1501 family)
MKPSPNWSRRRFLGEAPCATLGSISLLSTLLQLKLANQAAAQTTPTDARSLVCIFLFGGMDSYNALVPSDDTRYAEYLVSRSNLALAQESLVGLTPATPPAGGATYGLHPGLAALAPLFNGTGAFAGKRRLSFITNMGTLVRPTTMAEYRSVLHQVPLSLFSHSDQQDQWQSSVPQGMLELNGWLGRCADVIHSRYNNSITSMSFSLGGNNTLQTGNRSRPFVVTPGGAPGLSGGLVSGDPTDPDALRNTAFKELMQHRYAHLLQDTFARTTKDSLDAQAAFQEAFSSFNDASMGVTWPSTNFAAELRAAVKGIAIRNTLGLRRQSFFINFGGWDHHGELLNAQAGMLPVLAQGLAAYQQALENLGLADDVLSYTASDFGRTLRSNGRGTDHAWGGNQMVLGGPVDGGKFFGTWPSLVIGGPQDVGLGGRLLPTTSIDEMYYGLLRWFGIATADFPYVLPNIENFHDIRSAGLPVPFLKPGVV